MNLVQLQPLDQLARDEVAKCVSRLIAKGLWAVPAVRVRIVCTLRGKTLAGQARPDTMTVRLSPDYYNALGEQYRATVAHEYAHLVVRDEERAMGMRRSRSHGPRWQRVMRALGYEPSRTLTTAERAACEHVKRARRVALFTYACAAGHTHAVGVVRHTKMLRGKGSYLCTTETCRALPNALRRIKFVKEGE